MMLNRVQMLRNKLPYIFLLITVAIVYGSCLGHDFLNLDDVLYVTENESIQGFTWNHLRTIFSTCYIGNYAPIQMLSYMFDFTIWGLQPGGFLLGNILLHYLNGILLYSLLLRWHCNKMAAAIGAALFLIHPVQVESVAWISQRKNLLAMFFFLLAWHGYCRYQETGKSGRLYYFFSITAFAMSLLSKSVAVIFPLALILSDYCKPKVERRFRLSDKAPYFIAAAVCAGLAIYSQSESFDGGRVPYGYYGDLTGTICTVLPVLCRYLGLLIWPFNLSADYNPPLHQSTDLTVTGAAILLGAIFFLGKRAFSTKPSLTFYLGLFWLGILPVSQIVPLTTLINDRYLYFPMLGVAGLTCALTANLERQAWALRTPFLKTAPVILLLFFAILSYGRVGVWHDSITLWRDTVTRTPDSSRAWGNLAEAYDRTRQYEAAANAYDQGLKLAPTNYQILYNWGTMYQYLGETDKAYELLTRLLQVSPTHIMGLAAVGDIHVQRHNYTEAERLYTQALKLQPDATQLLEKLANLNVLKRRFDQATK